MMSVSSFFFSLRIFLKLEFSNPEHKVLFCHEDFQTGFSILLALIENVHMCVESFYVYLWVPCFSMTTGRNYLSPCPPTRSSEFQIIYEMPQFSNSLTFQNFIALYVGVFFNRELLIKVIKINMLHIFCKRDISVTQKPYYL